MLQILPMQLHHLDGVQTVQRHVYGPALWEANSALAQKQQLSAGTCLVAQNGSREIIAYLFSHPWHQSSIPPLNTVLPGLPDDCDVLYVHDLAVHPNWHGQGIAQQLMASVRDRARKLALNHMALVAVQGAQSFWQRQGFEVVQDTPAELQHKLSGYGDDAVYMTTLAQKQGATAYSASA